MNACGGQGVGGIVNELLWFMGKYNSMKEVVENEQTVVKIETMRWSGISAARIPGLDFGFACGCWIFILQDWEDAYVGNI